MISLTAGTAASLAKIAPPRAATHVADERKGKRAKKKEKKAKKADPPEEQEGEGGKEPKRKAKLCRCVTCRQRPSSNMDTTAWTLVLFLWIYILYCAVGLPTQSVLGQMSLILALVVVAWCFGRSRLEGQGDVHINVAAVAAPTLPPPPNAQQNLLPWSPPLEPDPQNNIALGSVCVNLEPIACNYSDVICQIASSRV
ncbi:uncharacterized protein LOC113217550 [Frankliniella occidentalis]|uniref:Uncharacterized protein LOC113217550 n=1 Tax=Frankliniella occidentalis TaxID=133901 RepID=A0A6J1TIG8_FRAOC|nr:uncharacterized protein LOC113217550 [Frankliniella occidentalis]